MLEHPEGLLLPFEGSFVHETDVDLMTGLDSTLSKLNMTMNGRQLRLVGKRKNWDGRAQGGLRVLWLQTARHLRRAHRQPGRGGDIRWWRGTRPRCLARRVQSSSSSSLVMSMTQTDPI